MTYKIAAFYRFVAIDDPAALQQAFLAAFDGSDLCGSMLIAPEGVNGTMAGSAETMERLIQMLGQKTGLPAEEVKYALAEAKPFGKLKFRLKKEIISFRTAKVDPSKPGTYVDVAQWNSLMDDPEVLVLDTRNRYEVECGTFAGAVDPEIDTFSEFATYVREHLDPAKHRKVAMFCTGGIRCEKASAFMLQEGFEQVYHLKGGILKYLEEVPQEESKWNGGCFVFDRRVAVEHADYKDQK